VGTIRPGQSALTAQELITEKDFQATVIDLARTYGWIVGFTHDARKSEPGEPDLRMVHPVQHRVIFAELKTVKGRLTKGRYNKSGRWLPGQDQWQDALISCPGVEYYLWRPDGLDGEIERILRGEDA
jgi:hypothetical protein